MRADCVEGTGLVRVAWQLFAQSFAIFADRAVDLLGDEPQQDVPVTRRAGEALRIHREDMTRVAVGRRVHAMSPRPSCGKDRAMRFVARQFKGLGAASRVGASFGLTLGGRRGTRL